MDESAAVLRNKGVAIDLAVLDGNGDQIFDDSGQARTERVWIKFTAATIADLEELYDGYTARLMYTPTRPVFDEFGDQVMNEDGTFKVEPIPNEPPRESSQVLHGITGFTQAMRDKPAAVASRVIALMLKRSQSETQARMLTAQLQDYSTALSIAWMLANGSDPEVLGKALLTSRQERKEQLNKTIKELDEQLAAGELTSDPATDESPGPNGSPSGSNELTPEDSDEMSMSSGN